MTLSDEQRAFLASTPTAAMITVGADGVAKPARVGIALLDGRLLSSGTADRTRTARLRRDPRCTLFVFEAGFRWLALESVVTIVEGDEAIEDSVRMFREMQGKPTGPLSWFGAELDEDAFRSTLRSERRLLYELEVRRAYGLV